MTGLRTPHPFAARLSTRVAFLAGLALAVLSLSSVDAALVPDSAQPAGGTRTNEGGQVTIAVTWSGNHEELTFVVVMDSHSLNLDSYNLLDLAILRTDGGAEIRPSGWDAPAGGHHREGTLTFPTVADDESSVVSSDTGKIELVIRDLAGVPERLFSWEVDRGLPV